MSRPPWSLCIKFSMNCLPPCVGSKCSHSSGCECALLSRAHHWPLLPRTASEDSPGFVPSESSQLEDHITGVKKLTLFVPSEAILQGQSCHGASFWVGWDHCNDVFLCLLLLPSFQPQVLILGQYPRKPLCNVHHSHQSRSTSARKCLWHVHIPWSLCHDTVPTLCMVHHLWRGFVSLPPCSQRFVS